MDAFDKTNWAPITFGEVCRNINVSEKDPITNGIERYVGLEHIEPNSLHIKSWGNIADGTTFTKKFRAGHVLFGKRRAYLRKAAVADFDGLCSGDILVFEANEDVIDRDLFPFLVQSDQFFDFAIQTSAGSLSPRTKFQDLARSQFLLPPKEQQANLAKLLWTGDKTIESKQDLLSSLIQLFHSCINSLITKSNYPRVPLDNIVDKLITYGIVQPGPNVEDGMTYIQSSDIKDGKVIISNLSKTSWGIAAEYKRSEVKHGDILFSLRGNLGESAIVPSELGVANLARGVARISLKSNYFNTYVINALQSTVVTNELKSLSQGSTFKEISLEKLRKLRIPVPETFKEQRRVGSTIENVKKTVELATSEINAFKIVQKQLINQIFS